VILTCPRCFGTEIVKAGKNSSGKQRFRCKNCTRAFVLNPYGRNSHVKRLACELSREGMSTRRISQLIERVYGRKFSHTAVFRWIKREEWN